MPAIIKFLGYTALPAPQSGTGERLVRCRTLLGLSQKVFVLGNCAWIRARQLGWSAGTAAGRGVKGAGVAVTQYRW